MPEYMLLLYDSPTESSNLSPDEIQRIIEKYRSWSQGLQQAGRYLGGKKLTDGDGRVLVRKGEKVRVLDGPYSETKEVIGGYMAIQAADYDDAVKVAESCPHLGYGGTIEIREIEVA